MHVTHVACVLLNCELEIQMLADQHDFLVIGVLGTQGVGKSTVMSALAGANRSKYVL